MPTFNGEGLLIVLDAGVAEVDAEASLYSAWKTWLKTGGNARYAPAFDTIGGDPTTSTGIASPFFFLRNDLGWRIRPAEEDANVTIVGNLYGRDSAVPVLTPTLGPYTVLVSIERDASAVVEAVTGAISEQDKLDIASAAWTHSLEGNFTATALMRLVSAALVGKLSGAPSSTITIRNVQDTKDRIIATVDDDANRLSLTLDVD